MMEEEEGEVMGGPCNQTTDEHLEVGAVGKAGNHSAAGASSDGGGGRRLCCVPTHMPHFLLAYTPAVSPWP